MNKRPILFDFDLIIIGAGINGAGVARDAAMRGLKVLLLDKGDVGGGTSSWSTRLIHGGLRYLEHGEFGLVRESLRERETLLRIAPHLVRPLPLLIPIYQHASRGRLMLRLGMIAYDLLSFDKTLPTHKMLSRADALTSAPELNKEGLVGAALYHDAQVEFAERLTLENVLAAKENGASVLTYSRVEKFRGDGDRLNLVEFIDEFTGSRQQATAAMIINAGGPWVDHILTNNDTAQRLIGGTKGSHLIVPPLPGAPETAVYVEAKADKRPFFIIPWNGKYLIGTTDIRFDGDLDNVRIDAKEIDYLLRETNGIFPALKLRREQILYTYSGVRPLAFANKEEQSITRRHFIRSHPHYKNLFSIVGGKLTTYRSLAEEMVDLVFKELRRTSPACLTAREPLSAPANPIRTSPLTARLSRIYGSRSDAIRGLIKEDAALGAIFDPESGGVAAEVVHAFRSEFARTLADCLLRRTMVGLNSSLGVGADEAAAKIGQQFLGWTNERAQDEVQRYRKVVERFRGP